MSVEGTPVAVISGGSSGIGLELARQLRAKGYGLVLLARDAAKLAQARTDLLQTTGPDIECHALDVSDAQGCSQVIAALLARRARIDWLITSAGMVEPGLVLDQSFVPFEEQMRVNYFGTLHLVHPVAAHMVARGQGGRITLVASAVSFGAVPGMAGYTASKNAVFGLAEALHVELAPAGVLVSVACPADTQTPQLEKEQAARPEITRKIAQGGGIMSARQVAHAIIAGVERGRFLIVPGAFLSAYGWLSSLLRPLLLRRQKKIAISDSPGMR